MSAEKILAWFQAGAGCTGLIPVRNDPFSVHFRLGHLPGFHRNSRRAGSAEIRSTRLMIFPSVGRVRFDFEVDTAARGDAQTPNPLHRRE
jgi:hypothetical protein